mmetsp:Transcript_49041/g.87442  ORF Transcript_49041/g.87442 Transcript_49041/m.87442 type:complete len:212 (+) Transcript_49041:1639-2274(+)
MAVSTSGISSWMFGFVLTKCSHSMRQREMAALARLSPKRSMMNSSVSMTASLSISFMSLKREATICSSMGCTTSVLCFSLTKPCRDVPACTRTGSSGSLISARIPLTMDANASLLFHSILQYLLQTQQAWDRRKPLGLPNSGRTWAMMRGSRWSLYWSLRLRRGLREPKANKQPSLTRKSFCASLWYLASCALMKLRNLSRHPLSWNFFVG